jgi:hypothetical protein
VFQEHWKPILEEMAEALPIPLNREQRRRLRQKAAG